MKLLFMVAFLFAGLGVAWSDDIKNPARDDLQLSDVGYRHHVDGNHEKYKKLWLEVNGAGLQPSDEKYMSEKYGPTYKKLYSGGKCACKSGYCRPSKWRLTLLDAPTGYDILVNQKWVPVPEGALHNEKTLSPELWTALMEEADAHVCAYPDVSVKVYGQRVECAIIPNFVG